MDGGVNTFQQLPHDVLPTANQNEQSRQEFAKSLKQYIQEKMLPGVKQVYEQRSAPRFKADHGHEPRDRHEARQAATKDAYFQNYLSMQRLSQELMWRSVSDSVERQLDGLIEKSQSIPKAGGSLSIQENFEPPRYATAVDIHCMPGGYANVVCENDVSAGAIYDRGVYLYALGYMGPYNDDMGRSVCNYLKRKHTDFEPKKIVDLGCTVGHSTLPYVEMFPSAEVHGVDIGEGLLRYAHARAEALGQAVHFSQQDAATLNYEDNSFDLVASHILLHETSGKAMPKIFEECYRILKPGGMMIHADLPPFENMDAYTQLILDNETYYNNEPFWGAMREVNQPDLAEKAGFKKSNIYFDTAPMAIMEFAQQSETYDEEVARDIADRDFEAGEYAPGGGWEVLVAKK